MGSALAPPSQDPSLGCGDIVSHADSNFVIRKVSYRYQYVGGSYRMVSKAADVKEASRDAVESFMTRMYGRRDSRRDDVDDSSGDGVAGDDEAGARSS